MLTENDIVAAVCDFLRGQGFDDIKHVKTNQHGDDIIANRIRDDLDVYVEAKGETSARVGSYQHGNPFDYSQVLVHVATAFYRAAKMIQETPSARTRRVAIALPDTDFHRRRVDSISAVLTQLSIGVFWVQPDKTIRSSCSWTL
jgi:hypothetical protein